MSDKVILGIDTSCYTTSIALTSVDGRLLYQQRRMLPVAAGEKGLRQSEAFYQHMLHLPPLFREMEAALGYPLTDRLGAVAVSVKPCRREDSYMPVFRAGHSVAQVLASTAGVPLIPSTHQEGHIMAALWAAGMRDYHGQCPFLAYHLSGGTTELIQVNHADCHTDGHAEYDENDAFFHFAYDLVSGTLDIPAGQLVDRTGQSLGLSFPSGPELEALAGTLGRLVTPTYSIPTYCREGWISFSGGEAWAKRALASGTEPAQIARSVEHYIAGSLTKSVLACLQQGSSVDGQDRRVVDEPKFVLFMGGVASNGYIRQRLEEKLGRRIPCIFPSPTYCADNAVGTALIGAASIACTAVR